MLIGQKIDGEIVKVIVEPYEFTNQRTGEIMTLRHFYAYRPKDSQDLLDILGWNQFKWLNTNPNTRLFLVNHSSGTPLTQGNIPLHHISNCETGIALWFNGWLMPEGSV